MMGWFTGKTEDTVGRITFEPQQNPMIIKVPEKKVRFITLEGAVAHVDEDTGKLEFTPRGPISISVDKIGAYYDNTVILFGNKIRVMETAVEIAVKITEAVQ